MASPSQRTNSVATAMVDMTPSTLSWSGSKTDKTVTSRYSTLAQPKDRVLVEYVWIDGTGIGLRSKCRTMDFVPSSVQNCPDWSFDGSSTGQADATKSDLRLHPVAMYNDPFRGGDNKLVLCEVYTSCNQPTETNRRGSCLTVMQKAGGTMPLFGVKQEFTLMDCMGRPFGWPQNGYPAPQGPYYCGVGADRVYGRDIIEAHYRACLFAGINILGGNAEVMPAQFRYHLGVCDGLEVADQLWMSRYILMRVAEDYSLSVSFDPKPVTGDWNGSGALFNFSTKAMREDGGLRLINDAITKLEKRHEKHMQWYDPSGGADNARRLTGRNETSNIHKFSSGIGDRTASVRIPMRVAKDNKGYLEDRRPSANCDPYRVTEILVRTVILNETA